MPTIRSFNIAAARSEGIFKAVDLPAGAVILSAAMMPQGPHVWALCPDESTISPPPPDKRYFAGLGDNQPLPDWVMDCRHIATLTFTSASTPGAINVSHLFEITPAAVQKVMAEGA